MCAQPIVGVWCDSAAPEGFSEDGCPFRPHWREVLQQAEIRTRCFGGCQKSDDILDELGDLDGLLLISERDLPSVDVSSDWGRFLESLIQRARDANLPFLGIGMGIQALNVAFGGTLQSVQVDPHWGTPHIQPHHPRHLLRITPGSHLEKTLDRDSLMVLSGHRVAVKHVAEGFRVSARSPDDSVEAIECDSDDWMALAVQFQPDMDAGCPMDIRLIEDFAQRVMHLRCRRRLVTKPR